MDLGMIGLGRMGANMTLRLVRGGHRVVGFDFNPEARKRVRATRRRVRRISSMRWSAKLVVPRTLWMMVPSGDATEAHGQCAVAAAFGRRHRHRRRQFELQGHAAPRADSSLADSCTMSTAAPAAASGA